MIKAVSCHVLLICQPRYRYHPISTSPPPFEAGLLFLFYRWENWDSEKFVNLSKVALLLTNGFETQTLSILVTAFLLLGSGVISILLFIEFNPPKYWILSSQDTLYNNTVVGAASLRPTLNCSPVMPGLYPWHKSGCYGIPLIRKIFVSSRWLEHQTGLLILQWIQITI